MLRIACRKAAEYLLIASILQVVTLWLENLSRTKS